MYFAKKEDEPYLSRYVFDAICTVKTAFTLFIMRTNEVLITLSLLLRISLYEGKRMTATARSTVVAVLERHERKEHRTREQ